MDERQLVCYSRSGTSSHRNSVCFVAIINLLSHLHITFISLITTKIRSVASP